MTSAPFSTRLIFAVDTPIFRARTFWFQPYNCRADCIMVMMRRDGRIVSHDARKEGSFSKQWRKWSLNVIAKRVLRMSEMQYLQTFLSVDEDEGIHQLVVLVPDVGHLGRQIIQEEDRKAEENTGHWRFGDREIGLDERVHTGARFDAGGAALLLEVGDQFDQIVQVTHEPHPMQSQSSRRLRYAWDRVWSIID